MTGADLEIERLKAALAAERAARLAAEAKVWSIDALMDANFGLGRHARRFRRQLDPFAALIITKLGDVERAVLQQVAVAGTNGIPPDTDDLIEEFATLISQAR